MKATQSTIQLFLSNIKIWQFAVAIELIIILLLIITIIKLLKIIKSNQKPEQFDTTIIKGSKETAVDMDNVINSMFNSKVLYDMLKKKIHPDRFPNDAEKAVASTLATQLHEQKSNYEKLKEIKAIAEEKLGLKF
jgi:hypothetical protein